MTERAATGAVINLREHKNVRRTENISPLAKIALDRCEEAFARAEWQKFGYWFDIFRRERIRVIGR